MRLAPRVSPVDAAAQAKASVVSAVAMVDEWFASATDKIDLDFSDHTVAAVEAAKLRATELGATVAVLPGKRVVLRLEA